MDKLLWTGEYDPTWDEILSEKFSVTKAGFAACPVMPTDYREHILRGEKLTQALQDKDIFLIGVDPLKEDVLSQCPSLKLVLSVRDGPEENVDIDTCTRLGIPVISSSGRCSISVAEYTFLLMMLLARPAHLIISRLREKKWTNASYKSLRGISTTSAMEIYGKTVGIVGMGRNGMQIATRAQAFGMQVVGYDPFVNAEEMAKANVQLLPLDQLMEQSDYIIVMARVTAQNKGMIGKEQIARMKKSACIINTARSALMDYDAVLEALRNDQIRAAALDTWPQEPIGEDSPFYDIPEEKLIITPHAAGFTLERTQHQYELLSEGFESFQRGVRPRGLCNPAVFDSPNFAQRGGLYWNVKKD